MGRATVPYGAIARNSRHGRGACKVRIVSWRIGTDGARRCLYRNHVQTQGLLAIKRDDLGGEVVGIAGLCQHTAWVHFSLQRDRAIRPTGRQAK